MEDETVCNGEKGKKEKSRKREISGYCHIHGSHAVLGIYKNTLKN